MSSEAAWNLIRLYYALSYSNRGPGSGGRIASNGVYIRAGGEKRSIVHSVYTRYAKPIQLTGTTEYLSTRTLHIDATYTQNYPDDSANSLSGVEVYIACGRTPITVDQVNEDKEIIAWTDKQGLWTDKPTFEANEYNATFVVGGESKKGKDFFFTHRLNCSDYVERLQPYV